MQTFVRDLLQYGLAVILGVISSFVVVFFVEWQRQPRLVLLIPPPSDQNYAGQPTPAQIMRCLRVRIRNRELPLLLRWMKRETARSCLGTVQFKYLDGRNYFTEAMPGRWAGSPEATPLQGTISTQNKITGDVVLWDAARMSVISKMDIPAGEQEDLDIAVRCDAESDAYGFNNESYRFNWRHTHWKLPKGRYFVEITIRSEGQKTSGEFLINNDLSRDEFRLESKKPSSEIAGAA